MIHLGPNETVLMTIHRHWIVIIGKVAGYTIILFVPFIIAPTLIHFGFVFTISTALFLFVIYTMIIALGLFIIWVEYYLDVWIITTHRIIDINQISLFHREISEFMLQNIQDVIVDIPGLVATFLKYGNVTVQTAGQASFVIKQAPDPYNAKDLILDYSRKQTENHVGTQQMETNKI